jgi:hypothetical protein
MGSKASRAFVAKEVNKPRVFTPPGQQPSGIPGSSSSAPNAVVAGNAKSAREVLAERRAGAPDGNYDMEKGLLKEISKWHFIDSKKETITGDEAIAARMATVIRHRKETQEGTNTSSLSPISSSFSQSAVSTPGASSSTEKLSTHLSEETLRLLLTQIGHLHMYGDEGGQDSDSDTGAGTGTCADGGRGIGGSGGDGVGVAATRSERSELPSAPSDAQLAGVARELGVAESSLRAITGIMRAPVLVHDKSEDSTYAL